MKKFLLLAVFTAVRGGSSQSLQMPQYHTIRVEIPIIIDGILDEDIWSKVESTSGFTQNRPNSGEPATQKTEVSIIYDDNYLYVGARLYDSEPDKIAAQLFRRDGDGYSDWFEIIIDSYNDHRTAFGFQVNPRGVLKDNLYYNDTYQDGTWDAVWEAASNINAKGWTVEIRIPFSQLRFNVNDGEMIWGLQFWRHIARNDERLFWAPLLEDSQGFVSNFGKLTGIISKNQPRRIEIMPYSSGKLLRQDGDDNDPYYKANDLNSSLGLDFKYGLGSNFTLTGTINPDFGQVEADPAVVNLSANETYFNERRPFFLEGTDIFSFGRTVTFNSNSPTIFYSRRIGRYPRGEVPDSALAYADYPDQTSILGAVKLSGKTSSGLSIGVLNALTSEESAVYIDTLNNKNSELVEPLGNSFVTRIKKDFRDGKSSLGGFLTSSYKDLKTRQLKTLIRENAVVAGLDFEHKLRNEDWVLSGYMSQGKISGTKEVITAAQRSSARYYQRPDQNYVKVDSNATSLSGYSYELSLMKNSGKHWQGSLTYGENSPGYELNDLGFQYNADYRSLNSFLIYLENTPGERIRNWHAYLGHWSSWTMGKERNGLGLFWGSNFNFNNFWNFEIEGRFGFKSKNIKLTRGGPASERPADWRLEVSLTTDLRKNIIFGFDGGARENKSGEYVKYISTELTIRPFPYLSLEFEASLSDEKDTDQYITDLTDDLSINTFGKRYVFSDIKSKTQSLSAQIDWTFTPDLTLQFFVSPFVTAYDYVGLKEFRTPGKFDFDYYGENKGTIIVADNGDSTIDPDGSGPAESFLIENEDFIFQSIRLNAVLRWEYLPGSTLFVVWQQERDNLQSGLGELNVADDYKALFNTRPINSFVIKISYWLGY